MFARLASRSSDNFVRVDVDAVPDVAQRYSVSAMPTFVLIKRQTIVATLKGADQGGLQRLVTQHAGSSAFSGSGHTLAGSRSTAAWTASSRTFRAGTTAASGVDGANKVDWNGLFKSQHAFPLVLALAYGLYVINLV